MLQDLSDRLSRAEADFDRDAETLMSKLPPLKGAEAVLCHQLAQGAAGAARKCRGVVKLIDAALDDGSAGTEA